MNKKTYNYCAVWVKKCYFKVYYLVKKRGQKIRAWVDPPPYSGNARKKTFFSIDLFPDSLSWISFSLWQGQWTKWQYATHWQPSGPKEICTFIMHFALYMIMIMTTLKAKRTEYYSYQNCPPGLLSTWTDLCERRYVEILSNRWWLRLPSDGRGWIWTLLHWGNPELSEGVWSFFNVREKCAQV